jgi:hypothetical protein
VSPTGDAAVAADAVVAVVAATAGRPPMILLSFLFLLGLVLCRKYTNHYHLLTLNTPSTCSKCTV